MGSFNAITTQMIKYPMLERNHKDHQRVYKKNSHITTSLTSFWQEKSLRIPMNDTNNPVQIPPHCSRPPPKKGEGHPDRTRGRDKAQRDPKSPSNHWRAIICCEFFMLESAVCCRHVAGWKRYLKY